MLHQVGAGVLGPVFRALDPVTDRTVAIKLFRLDLTPEQAVSLAGELSGLIGRLPAHEGLLGLVAAGTEGSLAFLVTDYAAADSVDQRLRRKAPTPVGEVLPLLSSVAAALDSAATVGVFHGALHPRDVLVSTVGHAALSGIGVAQSLERVGYRPPFRRPYAAPERVAGRPWGERADVFSLAVLAVELVTGRRPLLPEHGVPVSGMTDRADRAHDVQQVLAAGLSEDPAERLASAGEWVQRLAAACGEAVPGGRRRGPRSVASRGKSRRMALAPEPLPEVVPTPAGEAQEADTPDVAGAAGPTVATEPPLESAQETDTHLPLMADEPAVAAVGADPQWSDSRPEVMPDSDVPVVARARSRFPWVAVAVSALTLGVWAYLVLPTPNSPRAATQSALAKPSTSETVMPAPLPAPERLTPAPAGEPASAADVARALRTAARRAPATERAAAPSRESAAARLLVRSSPEGALVAVDGIQRGRSPLALRDLTYGPHSVVVELPGYRAERRAVALSEARPAANLVVDLAPIEGGSTAARGIQRSTADPDRLEASSLQVVSLPAGARVFLNGRPVGTTPLRVANLPSVAHTVTLQAEGFRDWSGHIRLDAGLVTRVTATLEASGDR